MRRFTYHRPRTAEQAAAAALASPDAAFIAGGTNLFDLMKLGVARPAALVDVTGLSGLSRIETGGDALRFGALATMADAAEDPVVKRDYPALSESLLLAASQQLRNMATLGGNVLQRTRCAYFRDASWPCNKREPGSGCPAIGGVNRGHAVLGTSEACIAAYPGDWAAALVAFEAAVETRRADGRTRTIAFEGLHRLPGDTPHLEHALEPGELITAFIVAKTPAGRRSVYLKVRDRESYEYAVSSAAVALDLDGGRVREARIGLGGVATKPWRAREAEAVVAGRVLTEALAREAGNAAYAGARGHGHNDFKIELGRRTVAEALLTAAGKG